MSAKAKTREQIANEYGIGRATFRKWLKEKGIELSNGLICPKEQEKIYEIFGMPKNAH